MKKTLWILVMAFMVMVFAMPTAASETANNNVSLKGTVTVGDQTVNIKGAGTYSVFVPCSTDEAKTFTAKVSLTADSVKDLSFSVSTGKDHNKSIKSWPYTAEKEISLKDNKVTFAIYAADPSTQIEKKYQVVVTLKAKHSYGDWEVTKEATCTDNGEKERLCQREGCDVVETEEIEALGHDFDQWTVVTEASDTQDGEAQRTCQRKDCDKIETKVLEKTGDDDIDDIDDDTDNIKDDGDEPSQESKVSDEEKTSDKNNTDNDKETSDNNVSKAEADKVVGHEHTYGEWKVVKKATCTEEGMEERTCIMEGCDKKETRAIAALGEHTWEDHAVVVLEPTCTETGIEGIRCKNCDAIKDKKVIPALGHKWNSGSVFKLPSDTETGIREHFCERCGHRGTSIIPVNGETKKTTSATPHTGDSNQMVICLVLMGLAIGGIGVTAVLRKRNV